MGHAMSNFFAPPWGPGEGSKGQISFNFNFKSISKIFKPNFVCVLTNERYKTYQTGFAFCFLGLAPGVVLGALGVPRGSKKLFKHCHVVYQIDGDDEQNRMQVKFSSKGQTGDLGARSKGQISLTCQFQSFLFQTVCVFSQIKDRKHIEQNFHSVAKVMPRGKTAGCWGSQKLYRGDLQWRPIDCAL